MCPAKAQISLGSCAGILLIFKVPNLLHTDYEDSDETANVWRTAKIMKKSQISLCIKIFVIISEASCLSAGNKKKREM